jgi:glucosamine--fructose-6-phosphate aminotransferase (isomerizing)
VLKTKSRLYQEIHEQPEVVGRLLDGQRRTMAELVSAIRARGVDQVLVAARGTSDNAGRYAQYALGSRNGLLVGLAAPSLFTLGGSPPRLGNALVVGISQSGRSPDIVAVLKEARRQSALTAVLTNDTRSDLAAHGDFVVDLGAGEERSVAATKTYTAQLAAIALLSASLSGDASSLAELARVPAAVAETLTACAGPAAAVAETLVAMRRAVVIGRGFNYATAFEIALKLKELTYVLADSYSAADLKHGPVALVEHGFPVMAIVPEGQMAGEMTDLVQQMRERETETIVVSPLDEALALAHTPLRLPAGIPEWLSPIVAVVPGQVFALGLAEAKGLDPDHPRGLQKITRTR